MDRSDNQEASKGLYATRLARRRTEYTCGHLSKAWKRMRVVEEWKWEKGEREIEECGNSFIGRRSVGWLSSYRLLCRPLLSRVVVAGQEVS